MPLDDAKRQGAIALFGEKYDEMVRVVQVDKISMELCGGTHVTNSGQIGPFIILSETGIAAGVRRIEAVAGKAALDYINSMRNGIKEIATALKIGEQTHITKILPKLENLNAELAETKEKLKQAQKLTEKDLSTDLVKSALDFNGYKIVVGKTTLSDIVALRNLSDMIRTKINSGAILLSMESNGSVNLLLVLTDDLVAKKLSASDIIKIVASPIGGSGGGRPQMAQAGGKNPAGIEEAFALFQTTMRELLNG
jgi:alanyl-tRNA synthetase